MTMSAVSIQDVDVLFGPASGQTEALHLLDSGSERDAILEQTGMVLGVANASLDVPAGSISVLMGLSGSGKSSLLRCINGLNPITRGDIHIQTDSGSVSMAACKGRSLRAVRRHQLAMVFQQFALLPWATVRENIGFGLSVRGEKKSLIEERVQQQLSLVGLDEWADKAIHTLSGGMQQRVGLARAFATDADILLMDEPFSALDPLIREHLQDELLSLQEKLRKTIVFVSHDLDEALKLGNQISIMEGGRIVQTGTVDDIVYKPASEYVRRFVANINPLSVLTASAIMKPLERHGHELLEHSLGIRVWPLADKSLCCSINDERQAVITVDLKEENTYPESIICVGLKTPVKALLNRSAHSTFPTLVADTHGEVCGVIGPRELCAALA